MNFFNCDVDVTTKHEGMQEGSYPLSKDEQGLHLQSQEAEQRNG